MPETPRRIEDSSKVPHNLQYIAYKLVAQGEGEAEYEKSSVNASQALKALEDTEVPPEIIVAEPYFGEPTDEENN